MTRAAETEQSSQLLALDAASRAEDRRRAFEKDVSDRAEGMVTRYRQLAEEAIARAARSREQAQLDSLRRMQAEDEERRQFEAGCRKTADRLVQQAKQEAMEAHAALDKEKGRFSALESEMRRQFEAHCRLFERRMRHKVSRSIEAVRLRAEAEASAAQSPLHALQVAERAAQRALAMSGIGVGIRNSGGSGDERGKQRLEDGRLYARGSQGGSSGSATPRYSQGGPGSVVGLPSSVGDSWSLARDRGARVGAHGGADAGGVGTIRGHESSGSHDESRSQLTVLTNAGTDAGACTGTKRNGRNGEIGHSSNDGKKSRNSAVSDSVVNKDMIGASY